MPNPHILIVGAHGKTGSRVHRRLQSAGVQTRGVSRTTNPSFDWTNPTTWPAALEGITHAYLTYHPDLSVPEAQQHIADFCALARASGVQHVVLLSGRGEEGAANAEQALRDSGLDWNILQASWFAQNFSENFLLDSVLTGELVLPQGTASEPFIDIDDIADVAVATLLEPGLRNRLFEVTGPRLMSFADCAQAISTASGCRVRLRQVPLETYLDGLREQQLPNDLIDLLGSLFSDLFDGRNATVADGVRQALGRPATDFTEYARKAAASGVWNQPDNGRVA